MRRFDNPRQQMAFLGLVPSERSIGEEKVGRIHLAKAISHRIAGERLAKAA